MPLTTSPFPTELSYHNVSSVKRYKSLNIEYYGTELIGSNEMTLCQSQGSL